MDILRVKTENWVNSAYFCALSPFVLLLYDDTIQTENH